MVGRADMVTRTIRQAKVTQWRIIIFFIVSILIFSTYAKLLPDYPKLPLGILLVFFGYKLFGLDVQHKIALYFTLFFLGVSLLLSLLVRFLALPSVIAILWSAASYLIGITVGAIFLVILEREYKKREESVMEQHGIPEALSRFWFGWFTKKDALVVFLLCIPLIILLLPASHSFPITIVNSILAVCSLSILFYIIFRWGLKTNLRSQGRNSK
jgi:hypothetical protein